MSRKINHKIWQCPLHTLGRQPGKNFRSDVTHRRKTFRHQERVKLDCEPLLRTDPLIHPPNTLSHRDDCLCVRDTALETRPHFNHPDIWTAAPGAGIIDTACLMASMRLRRTGGWLEM